jgi:hypothetical protein
MSDFDMTVSPYLNKQYENFYDANNYIPELFYPYNCVEVIDYAPSITTKVGMIGGTSFIAIIETTKQN